jgi:hypothetical protein
MTGIMIDEILDELVFRLEMVLIAIEDRQRMSSREIRRNERCFVMTKHGQWFDHFLGRETNFAIERSVSEESDVYSKKNNGRGREFLQREVDCAAIEYNRLIGIQMRHE